MNNNKFDLSYFAKKLEKYSLLFYNILSLGQPVYTQEIKTAGVTFENNKIKFYLNKNFFEKLNLKTQLFTLAHESLHIFFDHIFRVETAKHLPYLSNIAQDIVINEILLSQYGFKLEELNFNFNICLIDTVFTKEQIKEYKIQKDKSYEYYYDILLKINQNNSDFNDVETIDNHDLLENNNYDLDNDNTISDFIKSNINFSDFQEEIKDMFNKVTSNKKNKTDFLNIFIEEEEIIKQNYWLDIVKNIVSTHMNKFKSHKRKDDFTKKNRKYVYLGDDFLLPGVNIHEKERKIPNEKKYNIAIYLDVSFSCFDEASIFFNFVKTIPEDYFNINIYVFSDNICQIDIKQKELPTGGGTSFFIIEEHIQENFEKYPDSVFIVTDGEGDEVYPQKPKNWIWFLTDNGLTEFISEESEYYYINNVKPKFKM